MTKIYRFGKICCFIIFIVFVTFLLSRNIFAESRNVINAGDCFPNIALAGSFCTEDRTYLGLTEKKSYTLNSIRADFIVAEFFSIYCPVCHIHAVKFNRLHKLIEQDNFISKNTKMIGIGTGNNNTEIEYFKNYFNIAYPCIADPDFTIHKSLKEPRTPLLVLVDKRANPYKILSILDFTKEPEILLQDIRSEIRNTQSRITKQKTVSFK
jgi:peroxiredoxin